MVGSVESPHSGRTRATGVSAGTAQFGTYRARHNDGGNAKFEAVRFACRAPGRRVKRVLSPPITAGRCAHLP